MAKLVQQSTANDPLFFFLVLTSDHISPATGLAPTVTLSKNGAAFGAPAGAVTEIANGWYQVAGNATDTNTLGDILLHASVATADNCDLVAAQVVSFNPRNANLGLTNVSANVAQWNGTNVAVPATAGIPDINVKNIVNTAAAIDANNLLKVDTEDWKGGVVPAVTVTGVPKVDVADWLGTAVTAATAGIPDVNVKNINNLSGAGITAVSPNVGTTQPINFTGTGGSALVQDDVRDINGVALAAQALAQSTQEIIWGTCSGGSTTTAIVSTLNNPASLTATGQLIGRTIIFLGNTTTPALRGQASNITNSTTGATPTLTFTTMTNAPANGDVFVVI